MFRGIDLNTGTIVSSPALNGPYSDYFDMFYYNCSDSTIYGFTHSVNQTGLILGAISPSTGSIYQISTNSFSNGYLNATYTADPGNGVLYYTASGHTIRSVDFTSGNVISDPPMIIPGGGNVVEMEYYSSYCNSISATNEIQEKQKQLSAFPNPTNGKITISIPENKRYRIRITNTLGALVYTDDVLKDSGTILIDLSILNQGIYNLNLTSETSETYNQQIVKIQ